MSLSVEGGEWRYQEVQGEIGCEEILTAGSIDFTEIFSLVVKLTTIRYVLSIVAADDLHLEQLDIKIVFLHGDLEENIYMMKLQGYMILDKEHLVCKIKKNHYLKQAPRHCYLKFYRFMANSGYTRLQVDHCCYFKYFENSYIILLLYVYNMLIAGSNMKENVNLKTQLARKFLMKDLGPAEEKELGPAKEILRMRISRERKKTIDAITSRVHWESAEEV